MHPVKSSAKPGAGFIEVSDIAIFNQLLDHFHDRADLFGTLPDHGNNRPGRKAYSKQTSNEDVNPHGAHRSICAEQPNQNSDRASILDISLYVFRECTGPGVSPQGQLSTLRLLCSITFVMTSASTVYRFSPHLKTDLFSRHSERCGQVRHF